MLSQGNPLYSFHNLMANYIHRNEVALELSKSAAALMIEDMKLVLQPDVEGSWLEPPEISATDTDNSNDKTEEVQCAETGVNYAGFGIKDNKVDQISSALDCQLQCQVRC